MNKKEFLYLLGESLSGLPEEDRERSVEYYSEIIDDSIEEGIPEDEAVSALGPVDEIVSRILSEISLPKLVKARVKPNRALKVWEIILFVLGSPVWLPMLAAALIIVLAAYIVIWSVIVVLYSLVVSVGAVALAGILGSVVYAAVGNFANSAMFLGAGLICAGLTVLFFLVSNQAVRAVVYLSRKLPAGIKLCFVPKSEEI